MNPSSAKSLSEDEDDLFYFESDHLALKGNKDYSEVLKTIFVLESQRAKAIKDYDKVVELHKEALSDPYTFVQKLKNGEDLGIPELQIIAEVPNVHWTKYHVTLPEEGLKFVNAKIGHKNESTSFSAEENDLRKKSDTHKKPWSTEEQRRLEELLVIYPPEPIEFRRFKKIAAALGNRTVKQVSSRVQKYFIKLYKAGLPIPGRIPKYAERTKKSKLHVHQRFNHYLFKPTTFFPQLDIPVTMNESETIPGPSNDSTSSAINPVNYLIPNPSQPAAERELFEEPKSDVDIQLEILRKVKAEKQKENPAQAMFRHFDFRCDYCGEEPIVGTRWHCETCEAESVDFCSDCVVSQMYSGSAHPSSHILQPVRFQEMAMNAGCSDSSSGSVSGSAFGSSIKNLGSSNETSSSESDDEQLDETESNMDTSEYLPSESVKCEIEEEEGEGDLNDFREGSTEIKTENNNCSIDYENVNENCGDNYVKREVHMARTQDNLGGAVVEQNGDLYGFHISDNNQNAGEHKRMLSLAHNISEIKDPNLDEENMEAVESNNTFNTDMFTDTQNVSYSYLHSHLLLDSDT